MNLKLRFQVANKLRPPAPQERFNVRDVSGAAFPEPAAPAALDGGSNPIARVGLELLPDPPALAFGKPFAVLLPVDRGAGELFGAVTPVITPAGLAGAFGAPFRASVGHA
jgi:hypothetical protein